MSETQATQQEVAEPVASEVKAQEVTQEEKQAPVEETPKVYEVLKCNSCGKRVEAEDGWVQFPCPADPKEMVIRCQRCRGLEIPYTCANGKFQGP